MGCALSKAETAPEMTPSSAGVPASEFLGCQGPVFVGEADAAIELGVAGESLFDAGHSGLPVDP